MKVGLKGEANVGEADTFSTANQVSCHTRGTSARIVCQYKARVFKCKQNFGNLVSATVNFTDSQYLRSMMILMNMSFHVV